MKGGLPFFLQVTANLKAQFLPILRPACEVSTTINPLCGAVALDHNRVLLAKYYFQKLPILTRAGCLSFHLLRKFYLKLPLRPP